jgi:apolipoprotein N-acyltransferase
LAPLLLALAYDARVGSAAVDAAASGRGPAAPAASYRPSRRPLALGFLTGVIYFTGTLYWITRVMAVYGGLQVWVSILINVALIAYLAVFPALFALIVRQLMLAHGRAAILASPLVWVASEVARGYFSGFPWGLLGYSQIRVLPIAQLASVGGVYGVSLLVAAVSAAVVFAASAPSRRYRYAPLGVTLLIVTAIAFWGSRRVASSDLTRAGEPVRVGLVQGNVDQAIKWDPASAANIFRQYVRQTRQAILEGARLILWPESSTPFMFEEDPGGADELRTLVRQAGVTLIFGSDQVERRSPARLYNSAFLLRPDGSTGGVYRKIRLVPFGEYVPMQRLLFFAAPLTEQVGTFTAGERVELLPVDGRPVSVAICYEIVYPELVRRFVSAGSQLLTTITNDAWFGETSAPEQHFEQASMRAIEEGRYLVRAANTGISGMVDPYGRVLRRSGIFEPAVIVDDVRFLQASTFYARHGDMVATVSLIATIALFLWPRRYVQ